MITIPSEERERAEETCVTATSLDPHASHSAGSVVLKLMGSAILWESTEDLKVRRVEIVPQKPLDLAC